MIRARLKDRKGNEFSCAKGDPLAIREMVENEGEISLATAKIWKSSVLSLAKKGYIQSN